MFEITSPAFSGGGPIPRAHTCDGADMSPPVVWSGAPKGTETFALIMDDPDAPGGTFVHWVLYELAADVTNLPASLPTAPAVKAPVAAKQGMNDFRGIGYSGPCPPPGPAHNYVFAVYALDAHLELPAGATKAVLLQSMEGHVLETARLTGKYGR